MLTWIFLVLLTGSIMVSDIRGSYPTRRKRSLNDSPLSIIDGRLPLDLSPYHYNVELRPDIYDKTRWEFTFDGIVSIYFTVINSTSVITVNAKELDINGTSIKVTAVPGQTGVPTDPVVSNWSLNEEVEFLEVRMTDRLAGNTNYILTVAFSGTVMLIETGLYWDAIDDREDERTKYIVTTQLQDHGGRLTFPCFDEPDFKATFNTTIVYRQPYTTFANMPRIGTTDRVDGWLVDSFATTPKMSLYLFAIAIGDFQKLDAESFNGYQVRILSRSEVIPLMGFTQKIAPMILAWLDCETGITYREPKMDYIAFPGKMGAMENWGLITYGEQILAVSPETSSSFGKQIATLFIAHETAHLWYGNLVTCKWWNDVWLNEGFATYYEYRAIQVLGWEGRETLQMVTQIFLENDQRNSSDPVRKSVPTVWYSTVAFMGSTYWKGGAMAQFLEGILTTYTFKRGMKNYMLKHQYGTVTTDDLWQSLTEQASVDNITNPDGSALDVKLRMDPWLNQMGFPLISVTRKTDGTAIVTQSHFLRPPNQIMNTTSPYNYRWHVPITVVSADSADSDWDAAPSAYLDIDKSQAIVSGFPKNLSRWAMINAKSMLYYRVKYDNVSFDAIVSQLLTDKNEIHVQSRSQFIDDAFSVARAGYFPETRAMESTLYLKNEYEWGPWNSALRHLRYSDRLIRNLSCGGLQRSYILGLAKNIYRGLGWDYSESESLFHQSLRSAMIDVTCGYGYEPCLAEARSQYARIKQNASANVVHPNNLPTVLCVGVSEGNEADWQLSYDQYVARKSSKIREEALAYLYGSSCTRNQTLIDRLLIELQKKVHPTIRDDLSLFLSQNEYGAQILWNYLDTNWSVLPMVGFTRETQLRNVAMRFSTRAELNKLYAFKERHQPSNSRSKTFYSNLILDVEANVKWVETEGRALKEWLLNHQPTDLNGQKRKRRSVNLPISAMEHWEAVRRSYIYDRLQL